MSLPTQAEYVIAGAGIHGLSTAWRLAERLIEKGENVEGRIVIIDKANRIAAGATGIACGVVVITIFNLLCESSWLTRSVSGRVIQKHLVIMPMDTCKSLVKK